MMSREAVEARMKVIGWVIQFGIFLVLAVLSHRVKQAVEILEKLTEAAG